jgi:hypothetical protein
MEHSYGGQLLPRNSGITGLFRIMLFNLSLVLMFVSFLWLLRASWIDKIGKKYNNFIEEYEKKELSHDELEKVIDGLKSITWFNSYIKKFNPFIPLKSYFPGEFGKEFLAYIKEQKFKILE